MADNHQNGDSYEWIRLGGGAPVAVDDDGDIVMGCPGLEGHNIHKLDDTRDEREQDQEQAEAAGWESNEQQRARAIWESANHGDNFDPDMSGRIALVKIGDTYYTFEDHADQFPYKDREHTDAFTFDEDSFQHHKKWAEKNGREFVVLTPNDAGGAEIESPDGRGYSKNILQRPAPAAKSRNWHVHPSLAEHMNDMGMESPEDREMFLDLVEDEWNRQRNDAAAHNDAYLNIVFRGNPQRVDAHGRDITKRVQAGHELAIRNRFARSIDPENEPGYEEMADFIRRHYPWVIGNKNLHESEQIVKFITGGKRKVPAPHDDEIVGAVQQTLADRGWGAQHEPSGYGGEHGRPLPAHDHEGYDELFGSGAGAVPFSKPQRDRERKLRFARWARSTMGRMEFARKYARRLKAMAGQMSLGFDRGPQEGETRVNRAGHQEVLRTGRWHLAQQAEQPQQPMPQAEQEYGPKEDYRRNGTRSKAFKAWFGDWEADPANSSKVVNQETGDPQKTAALNGDGTPKVEDGQPFKVYHGTKTNFESFDESKNAKSNQLLYGPGFYFTEDKSVAEEYANNDATNTFSPSQWERVLGDIEDALPDGYKLRLTPRRSRFISATVEVIDDQGHSVGHAVGVESNHQPGYWDFSHLSALGIAENVAGMKGLATVAKKWGPHSEVKEVYLNIRNPFHADLPLTPEDGARIATAIQKRVDSGAWKIERQSAIDVIKNPTPFRKFGNQPAYSTLQSNDIYTQEKEHEMPGMNGQKVTSYVTLSNDKQAIAEILRDAGFDGITHIGGKIMGGGHLHRVWIAFNPTQIKSVDNEGTFNPNDPRMKYTKLASDIADRLEKSEPLRYAMKKLGPLNTLNKSAQGYKYWKPGDIKQVGNALYVLREDTIGKPRWHLLRSYNPTQGMLFDPNAADDGGYDGTLDMGEDERVGDHPQAGTPNEPPARRVRGDGQLGFDWGKVEEKSTQDTESPKQPHEPQPATQVPAGLDPVAFRKGLDAHGIGIRNPAAAGLKPGTLPWKSWLAGYDSQEGKKKKPTASPLVEKVHAKLAEKGLAGPPAAVSSTLALPTTRSYFNGDEIELTGKTTTDASGAEWEEFKYLEGTKQGQTGVRPTKRQKDANTAQRQQEYRDQQSQFAQLHTPEAKAEAAKPVVLPARDLFGNPVKPPTAPHKPATFDHGRGKETQGTLIAGLDALPGQMNLFADNGVPDDMVGMGNSQVEASPPTEDFSQHLAAGIAPPMGQMKPEWFHGAETGDGQQVYHVTKNANGTYEVSKTWKNNPHLSRVVSTGKDAVGTMDNIWRSGTGWNNDQLFQKFKAGVEGSSVTPQSSTDQIVDSIHKTLESLQGVRDAIKSRSMLYQPDLKDEVAAANGVDPQTYYDMPYKEWEKVRDAHNEKKSATPLAENPPAAPTTPPEPAANPTPPPTPSTPILPHEDLKEVVRQEAVKRGMIVQDFGEKIGGARKDVSRPLGPRSAKKEVDSRPAWARRYKIFRIDKSNRPSEEGKYAIYDLKDVGWNGQPRQKGELFDSEEAANKALPLLAVARNHSIRMVKKPSNLDATNEATAKQLEENAGKIKALQDEHQSLLTQASLSKRYKEALAQGKITQDLFNDLQSKGRILSDEEEAKAAGIEQQIRELRDIKDDRKLSNDGEYEIYRTVAKGKYPVIKGGFSSKEEAMAYLAGNAESIIEHQFPTYETYQYLDEVKREGKQRRSGDVDGKKFQSDIGFRAGEFGNWQTNKDGQTSLNHAYDALHDMADLLGFESPRDVSLDGKLAIAFGARGTGGKHAARAHYERDKRVMNLTKMAGAGSLAHEWAHALDHHISGDPRGVHMASEIFNGGHTPEVKAAIKHLVETMTTKDEEYVEDATKANIQSVAAEKQLAEYFEKLEKEQNNYSGYGRKPKSLQGDDLKRWNELKARAIQGDIGKQMHVTPHAARNMMGGYDTGEVLDELNKLHKKATGRSFHTSADHSTGKHIYWTAKRLQDANKKAEEASKGTAKKRRGRSNFMNEAIELDKTRAEDYYTEHAEMLARAFEAYIADKLHASNTRSDYLVGKHKTNNAIYRAVGMAGPFPEGDERVAINKAFDNLIQAIKNSRK